jgi:hypothetical protein
VADDERIAAAVRDLVRALRTAWPTRTALRDGVASVDACLRASAVVDAGDIVPAAVEELERVVGGAYQPGDGVQGSYADQVSAAGALLTAFEVTGRLPYSMLAEELMQTARRMAVSDDDLVPHCDAARVLCRLAALHADADYRAAAVVASDADYRGEAARLLQQHEARALGGPLAHAALYGLALREFMALR